MPRGNNQRGRGARGSPRGGIGRGRGRGGNGRGRGRGGGGAGGFQYSDALDFPIQVWPDNDSRGSPTPRGRGRGTASPRGRGWGDFDSPRGGGRGRGGGSKLRPDAPLSKLLYESRPLLRPIIFVRSEHTRRLFEEEEDILQPGVEEAGENEETHVPTADSVTRIFSGNNLPPPGDDDSDSDSSDDIEEIDFQDMAKLRAEIDAEQAPPKIEKQEEVEMTVVEEKFTGFFIDTEPAREAPEPIAVDRVGQAELLGDDAEDDEVIVYVAPHPRSSQKAPVTPPKSPSPSLPSTSMLTGMASTSRSEVTISRSEVVTPPELPPAPSAEFVKFSFADSPVPKKQQPRHAPVFSAGGKAKAKAKARKKEARAARRRAERHAMFGSFGAILSEAQLRGEETKRDPRWEERRHGDSDVDWGDSDGGGDAPRNEVDEVSEGIGAMELDPDLEIDAAAMASFVQGMGANGSRHVTMDDIEDGERMRAEDAASAGGTSDDDMEEDVIRAEEAAMMGEFEQDSESETEDSEDEDETPRRGFTARLERLRDKSRGRKIVDKPSSADEEDMSDDGGTWADQDERFIAQIEDILDGNDDMLNSRNRKDRNRLFNAVFNGEFDDFDGTVPVKRNKDKNIPPHLQEQWDRDRARKAEFKRVREQARIDAAADPLVQKKGGKKGRKATIAAARFDPSIEIPNRVVDMQSVVQQIRRFLADIGGRQTMALPPMEKEARRNVHELAMAFGLKSESKGNGATRYTTLKKKTRSGVAINHQKIAKILRKTGGGGFSGPDMKGKGKVVMPRHKDGDEVGKAAPKIGDTNVGFKMLASMGWTDGQRIGVTGPGLDVPITAVIKNTKLGLGANVR
ncbi:hypothetical protein PLICRDRAFT_133640 [Plicaturopsis crispa FD-325 SS-3]|nr:hypothetical protein PLICRDRAFT_133640 [Plicaturopsis crispa FD-325 SS-3]